jgi:hypothetical protein
MKVWVTRDVKNDKANCGLWAGEGKPTVDRFMDMFVVGGADRMMAEWNHRVFKRIFGFTPRKGTCKKYELTLKEVVGI